MNCDNSCVLQVSGKLMIIVVYLQVRESKIMAHVWSQAADRDKLNKELRRLGFFGLMQQ